MTADTETPTDENLEEQLHQYVQEENWSGAEELWLELSDQAPGNPDIYQRAIEGILQDDQKKRAQEMAELMSSTWREHEALGATFSLLRPLVEQDCLPHSLEDPFLAGLKETFDDHPALMTCLDISNIRERVNQKHFEKFQELISFRPDAYVYHSSGWGPGQITDVLGMSEKLVVDFIEKPSHEMKLHAATKYLDVLSPNDPRALAYQGEDVLKEELEENPQEVILTFLKARGTSVPLKQLRNLLKSHVFSSSQWSRWWNRTKSHLMEHPNIEISGKSTSTLSYREEAYSMVQEAIDNLQTAPTPKAFLKEIRRYRKYLVEKEERYDEIQKFLLSRLNFFRDKMEDNEQTDKDFVDLLYYLRRKTEFFDQEHVEQYLVPLLDEILESDDSPRRLARLLNHLSSKNDSISLLSYIHEHLIEKGEDTIDFYHQFMRYLHGRNWENVAKQLLEKDEKQALTEALYQICGLPGRYPLAYIGLVKTQLRDTLDPVEEFCPSNVEVLKNLIELAAGKSSRYLPDSWTVKKFVRKVESLLMDHPEELIEKPSEFFNDQEKQQLRKKIRKNTSLKDSTRAKLLSHLESEQDRKEQQTEAYFWEGERIYSTKDSIERKNEEYQEIISEKIPENQQAIKKAREFGDLSENAEYDAALEERSMLMAKARKLKKELEQARSLESAPVQNDQVQPGTAIEVKNLSENKHETLTILGPWDSDAEENIISYETPLARGLLGAKEGETLEISIPSGTKEMKIEEIEKVI